MTIYVSSYGITSMTHQPIGKGGGQSARINQSFTLSITTERLCKKKKMKRFRNNENKINEH